MIFKMPDVPVSPTDPRHPKPKGRSSKDDEIVEPEIIPTEEDTKEDE